MLAYVSAGSGPPLLLIHGIGHNHRGFDDVAPRLQDAFTTYAIDLPGFGDSAPLEGPPTMRALADACAAFMADQGHSRFHVAGNSLGGAITLHLALDGRALSACALCPAGFDEGWERVFLHVSLMNTQAIAPLGAKVVRAAGGSAAVRRAVGRQVAEHGDRLSAAVIVDTFERLAAAPAGRSTRRHAINWRCPSVAALPCPTTVLWGEQDKLLLYKPQSARARERLPTADHVSVPDCGHLPMWDAPELTAATIRSACG